MAFEPIQYLSDERRRLLECYTLLRSSPLSISLRC